MNKFIRADFKTYKPKYKLYCKPIKFEIVKTSNRRTY